MATPPKPGSTGTGLLPTPTFLSSGVPTARNFVSELPVISPRLALATMAAQGTAPPLSGSPFHSWLSKNSKSLQTLTDEYQKTIFENRQRQAEINAKLFEITCAQAENLALDHELSRLNQSIEQLSKAMEQP
eukprot:c23610_g1_i1.p2 GENE.c23610_g1_i1~~c23610_g1_i1.p2  ORF type:complete len:132 (-),score=31.08 c23610_g1_i1:88-483(-)